MEAVAQVTMIGKDGAWREARYYETFSNLFLSIAGTYAERRADKLSIKLTILADREASSEPYSEDEINQVFEDCLNAVPKRTPFDITKTKSDTAKWKKEYEPKLRAVIGELLK